MIRNIAVGMLAVLALIASAFAASPGNYLAQIENNKNKIHTVIGSQTMHIAYRGEITRFYKPIEISDSKTTALALSTQVFTTDPSTGKTTPQVKLTSFSTELNLAYETNFISVDAWLGETRSRIVECMSTTVPLELNVVFDPTSDFYGTHRLCLFYDGEISTGLIQYKNSFTGVIRSVALEKPGNALSLYLFSPIHAYAAKLYPDKCQIETKDKDVVKVTQGQIIYKFLPEHGLIIGERIQNSSRYEIHTKYSDFRSVSGSQMEFPYRVVENKIRKDNGQLESRSVITYADIKFVGNSEVDKGLFELKVPATAEFTSDPILSGAMMR